MNFDQVARFAACGMLNSLLAGLLVAAIAWVAVRLVDRYGAAVRFSVWLIALCSIVFLIAGGLSAAASYGGSPPSSAGVVTLPARIAWYLFAVWLAGAVIGLARVGYSLFRLRRLSASCIPIDVVGLDPQIQAALLESDPRRCVILCESEEFRVPAALGYFRPMVVFPKWALQELPPSDVGAILRHELAHLRRYDDWTNLAQKIIKAVLFFHPAVWFVESRLTLEREMACDDAVLGADIAPRDYAESLVNVAERSFLRRSVQLAQAAIGHTHQLKLRLIKILSSASPSKGRVGIGRPAAVLLSLAGIVAVTGIAHTPRLIGFGESTVASAEGGAKVNGDSSSTELPKPLNASYVVHDGTPNAPAHVNVCIKHSHASRTGAIQPAAFRPSRAEVIKDTAFADELLPEEMVMPVFLVVRSDASQRSTVVVWHVVLLQVSPSRQVMLLGGLPHQI